MRALIVIPYDTAYHSSKDNNLQLPNEFFNLLGVVSQINIPSDVLVLGDFAIKDIAKQISGYRLVHKVLTIENPLCANLLAENIAPIIATIAKSYSHVLMAADSVGKNTLSRVAGILGVGQLSEIVSVVSPNIFKRFMYAGNILAEFEMLDDIKLLTVRTNNFVANKELYVNDISAPIEEQCIADGGLQAHNKVRFIAHEVTAHNGANLSQAKIVVSGGRSLASRENFERYIYGLAAKINAGVGATRAAVEAGYASNDCQVGQTGKVVAPELYLAIGLSGAIQHITGMKDSKMVIAINSDKTAPIFEYADYGLVGDLFEVIPQLLEQI